MLEEEEEWIRMEPKEFKRATLEIIEKKWRKKENNLPEITCKICGMKFVNSINVNH